MNDRDFVTPPIRRVSARVNESPLTFVRTVVVAEEPRRMNFFEKITFRVAEASACLNRDTGTHYRDCLYAMASDDQFDTMLMRRLRSFFTVSKSEFDSLLLPPSVLEHYDHPNNQNTSQSVAVPKHDPQAYRERAYLLLLGQDPVARISIEHAIEELLERCEFLRDPESSWISRPDRMHVLLAVTDVGNVTREERWAKRVIHNSPPVVLRLHRFQWRRQGTLYAQWHCVGGNIDRLRADLRTASKAKEHKCFTESPDEFASLGRPFAVETLVMALLTKPTAKEFEQLALVTDEMSKMFSGVTATLGSVTRVAQLHDHLDREAMNGQEAELELDANFPHDDPSATAIRLMKTSPTIKRIVGASLVAVAGTAFVAWRVFHCRK